jgi:hypothetical protein
MFVNKTYVDGRNLLTALSNFRYAINVCLRNVFRVSKTSRDMFTYLRI